MSSDLEMVTLSLHGKGGGYEVSKTYLKKWGVRIFIKRADGRKGWVFQKKGGISDFFTTLSTKLI